MLDWIVDNKTLKASGVLGFFPANSVGDDIEVYSDEDRSEVLSTFINLRSQVRKTDNTSNLCLADFLAPRPAVAAKTPR